jgi:chromosome segregation ATPase
MSEDDKAQIKEFDARVKRLDAEREKRSKGLLTELSKLRTDIGDICRFYNERLSELRETKMVYDGAVYECELLVIRLAQARHHLERFEKHSTELDAELTEQQASAREAKIRLSDFNVQLARQTELVEQLQADDKALEKAFRRDFADVPEHVEALRKLFSRRKAIQVPKGSRARARSSKGGDKGAKAKQSSRASAAMMVAMNTAAPQGGFGDDGGEGGAVAGGRDPFGELDQPETEAAVEPLDAGVDMPEGLSFDVWDRLVDARNAKIESEEELRGATATLEEMRTCHAMLSATDERLRSRIEVLSSTLAERRAQEVRGAWNLELPFKLKQGQVEVEEAAVVTDFGGAVLIHRDEVAGLNRDIRKLGGEKVEILNEIRDFRKGIVVLEWENKRLEMESQDMVERTKEFQLLRVTKDLQSKIRGGAEENQQVEVASLEKKMESIKASHEEKVADLRRQVAKINAMIADRRAEMESLQGQIEQLEGSVLEREMIHSIQSTNKDASGDGFKRFEEIHMKRKLQTLVGMQTQEIGLLRDELDRLRRRTFPTFTHLSAANADRAL